LFSDPAVSIKFLFKGTSASVYLKDFSDRWIEPTGRPRRNMFNVYIDQNEPFVLELGETSFLYLLAKDLKDTIHSARIVKRTESLVGKVEFSGVQLDTNATWIEQSLKTRKKMEFIGNSITCGYGVEAKNENKPFDCETENASLSYGALTAQAFDADYVAVAYSGRGVAQNYGGQQASVVPEIWKRIFPDEEEPLWDHNKYIPDIACINLGTNDVNSGAFDTTLFKSSYAAFIEDVRDKYSEAIIVCLLGPMLNDSYPSGALSLVRNLISSVINEKQVSGDEKLYFFEFSPQTGRLGYGADWHPSVEQQRYNADELIAYIKEITDW
jgi:lysophospholipase L1-like esterase